MKSNFVKHWLRNITLMLVLSITMLVLILVRGVDEMGPVSIYHVGAFAFTCFQNVVIYRGFTLAAPYIKNDLSDYVRFMTCNFICALIWGYIWMANGTTILIGLRRYIYFAQYCISYIGVLFLFIYTKKLIDRWGIDNNHNIYEHTLKRMKTFNKIYIFFFALLIISLATGLIFTVDASGYYHKGSYSYIPAMLNIALSLIFVILSREVSNFPAYKNAIVPFVIMNFIALFWNMVSPYYEMHIGLMAASEMVVYVYTYIELQNSNQALNKRFSTYVSTSEAVKVVSGQTVAVVGGERLNVSVIMSEMRDFNLIAKLLSEQHIEEMLNHFLSTMTRVIEKHNGLVLGFPGYGILAVFGAPDPCDNHAIQAVDAALDMMNEMKNINKWYSLHNCPEVQIGIGVSTGDAIIGNIGSENHLRYSAISRIVNLCSRIQSYANDGEILITHDTKIANGDRLITENEEEVNMKGFIDPIIFYSVKGKNNHDQQD